MKGFFLGERSPLVDAQADSCTFDEKQRNKKKKSGFGFLAPSVSETSSSVLILSRMVHFSIKSTCRIS